MKLEDKFTNAEVISLRKRMAAKEANAEARSIEYTLTEDDWCMFGEKLLGRGLCDYAEVPFTTEPNSSRYPSIERIDQTKGYIRGNIAIVGRKINTLKDFLVDKTRSHIDRMEVCRTDGDLLGPMFVNTSAANLEKLKSKYVPVETTTTNSQEEPTMTEPTEIKSELRAEPDFLTGSPAPLTTKVELDHDLPEDVRMASAYVRWSNVMTGVLKLQFKLTFAQFKAVYSSKTCNFTKKKFVDNDKVLVILDRTKPVEAGNVMVTYEKFGLALSNILDVTGGNVADLAKTLKKFA